MKRKRKEEKMKEERTERKKRKENGRRRKERNQRRGDREENAKLYQLELGFESWDLVLKYSQNRAQPKAQNALKIFGFREFLMHRCAGAHHSRSEVRGFALLMKSQIVQEVLRIICIVSPSTLISDILVLRF
jgi:hypothetical protein